ncbi:MAG: GNAT family N-acetyltransferase [Hungatella sp.]
MLLREPGRRFEEIYQIYEEAFPEIERRTYEGQKQVLRDNRYRLRMKELEGAVQAFLGYWELPNCIFLEHLATTKACRGLGYGKELVLECVTDTDKPIFLEIEPIHEQKPMTARRAGFYERLNFHVNRFPYEQMPLKDGDAPLPLWVMSYGEPFSKERFLPYKTEIYHHVYGIEIIPT